MVFGNEDAMEQLYLKVKATQDDCDNASREPIKMMKELLPKWSSHIVYENTDLLKCKGALMTILPSTIDMRSGLANHLRKRYNHESLLVDQRRTTGHAAVLTPKQTKEEDRFIFYLLAKISFCDRTSVDKLASALMDTRFWMEYLCINEIHTHKLGQGYDGLAWETVYDTIAHMFNGSDLKVIVHTHYNLNREE